MSQKAIAEFESLLGRARVLSGAGIERAYDCDAYTVDKSSPVVVVLPETTEEVSEIVKICCRNGLPFTPRGAGTGLSGGSLAAKGGVIISTKRMTKILEWSTNFRIMRAQAGAVNTNLTKAVAPEGFHFAPDPSSQSVSTLGGNIAENSGGPHTLKYGVTAAHVLKVTMVAFDGEIIEIGGLIDGAPGLDLIGLVCGSEGTLGIVTEAVVKLTPNPDAVETVLVAFPETRAATQTVAQIIASGITPAALEMMDRYILAAVHDAFGLDFPPGTDSLLLVECDGAPEATRLEIEKVEEICRANGAISVERAMSEDHRKKLWTARKKGVGAMGRIAPTLMTHDGVIPRSKLPDMLEFIYETAHGLGLTVANIFHAGDGNLHPIFCFDDREPGAIDKVVEAGEKIMRRCVELGGSVTGEHGIGVEKVDMIKLMFSPDDLRLQEMARDIFHQSELCNPCKVIPNQKGCVEHMRRWRGAAT